ncbi:MAG: 23S rRNA (uridine(2552)-2'-O)-methyltransferase RlmE [Gammaproteobacteria bacterium]|nr:23S rRNA (uridine(2552)-2'-O)-methyltransferase RlmE [Gammaproteobacteria bacterium]MDH5593343.1 23S rRNA (uridine(2552)-2'-O)-methyltransferase RlmE [Gammaproteobacteria bacterium]
MARSKTSKSWLKEHFDDHYVKMAQKDGARSRAVYKLKEIQEKDRLLKPGMKIVDLGAAPGGWSQYASSVIGEKGKIVALDILEMAPLVDVTFIQGDFTEEQALAQLRDAVKGECIDLVMSDMAPNITGIESVDQPRSMYLVELALDFAKEALCEGGDLLMKVFQGEGYDAFYRSLRNDFSKVTTRKPKASRPRSREVYVLARGYNV